MTMARWCFWLLPLGLVAGLAACSERSSSSGGAPAAASSVALGSSAHDAAASPSGSASVSTAGALPDSADRAAVTACRSVGRPASWGYCLAATALLDGKVLISGGRQNDGSDWLKSTQIFDPAQSKFLAARPMSAERMGHSSVRLLDGTVLVAGGMAKPLELYDARTAEWAVVGKLEQEKVDIATARLPDGRVLLIGGDLWADDGLRSSDVVAWDPKTRMPKKVATLPHGFSGIALSRPDGRFLLLGKGSGAKAASGTRPGAQGAPPVELDRALAGAMTAAGVIR